MKYITLILLAGCAFTKCQAGFAFGGTRDTNAFAWATNVMANGGVSANTSISVNNLAFQLKRYGLWTNLYALNPIAGRSYLGALVKLKTPSGISVTDTNHAFAASNYVERGASRGLTGDGTSKYLDTGVNLLNIGARTNSLSLWAHTYTTATNGSTRVTLSAKDASANSTVLGWVMAGTQETGVVGTGNSAQYPSGSATSLTGLLGVSCTVPPVNLSSSTAYTNAYEYDIQGLAYDGTNEYVIFTTNIIKLNQSTRTASLTNFSPFAGMVNINHLGDGEWFAGKLYIPAETTVASGTIASNASIAIYNASDLSLVSVTGITNIVGKNTEIGAIAIGNSTIYCSSYFNSNSIWCFNLSDLSYQSTITLDLPISRIQGITHTNNSLIVSVNQDSSIRIWLVDAQTGHVYSNIVFTTPPSLLEQQGGAIIGANFVQATREAAIAGNGQYARAYPFTVSPLRGLNQFYQNGSAIGSPTNSIDGLANCTIFYSAQNNGGTAAAFCYRRLGLWAIGSGLIPSDVARLYTIVNQFNTEMTQP